MLPAVYIRPCFVTKRSYGGFCNLRPDLKLANLLGSRLHWKSKACLVTNIDPCQQSQACQNSEALIWVRTQKQQYACLCVCALSGHADQREMYYPHFIEFPVINGKHSCVGMICQHSTKTVPGVPRTYHLLIFAWSFAWEGGGESLWVIKLIRSYCYFILLFVYYNCIILLLKITLNLLRCTC